MYVLNLTASGAEMLARPIRGSGGFQTLLRALRTCRRSGSTIFVDGSIAERITRYSSSYGEGGFQGRLRRLGTLRRVDAA